MFSRWHLPTLVASVFLLKHFGLRCRGSWQARSPERASYHEASPGKHAKKNAVATKWQTAKHNREATRSRISKTAELN
jgi:hypothetical protein